MANCPPSQSLRSAPDQIILNQHNNTSILPNAMPPPVASNSNNGDTTDGEGAVGTVTGADPIIQATLQSADDALTTLGGSISTLTMQEPRSEYSAEEVSIATEEEFKVGTVYAGGEQELLEKLKLFANRYLFSIAKKEGARFDVLLRAIVGPKKSPVENVRCIRRDRHITQIANFASFIPQERSQKSIE